VYLPMATPPFRKRYPTDISDDDWAFVAPDSGPVDHRRQLQPPAGYPLAPRRHGGVARLPMNRWLRYRGQSRPDMAPGCPEKIDWEFLQWI
jgi:hypothetical protein